VAALYALAFVPVTGVAIVASAWVMDLSHRQAGPGSDLAGWALNVLPSLAVGFAAYFGLARILATSRRSSKRAHLRRTVALYVVALALGGLMLHDGSNPDFWRFGQLVLWPWVTAVAGILADAITTIGLAGRVIART
jgi:hypothetical protein